MSEKSSTDGPRTVADLMRREVVTIGPEATIIELARLLRHSGVSGLPVVDDTGQAVGAVSVTDLLWLGDRMLPSPVPPPPGRRWEGLEGRTVRDVMSAQVYGLAPDDELDDLLEFFSNTGLRRAFVMEDRRVVGVVSVTDLLDLVDPPAPPEPGDDVAPPAEAPVAVPAAAGAGEPTSFRLLDAGGLEDVLRRMARRIHARTEDGVSLVGIQRRGVPLAHRVAEHLRRLGRTVDVGEIGLTRYDDDLSLLHEEPRMGDVLLPFDAGDADVVLVDDVLFSGRTLAAATTWLVGRGARRIEAAVVGLRGRPALPLRADTVGMSLDVAADTIVEVRVPPFDEEVGVWLRRRPG